MNRLLKILSFGSVGVLVAVLVVATLLENVYGSSFVQSNIYHSLWFVALWAVLAIAGVVYILRVARRGTLIFLHASFGVILFGAFVSYLTSSRGNIMLVRDTVPASMYVTDDGSLEKLPFRLQLAAVDTLFLPGTQQVADYRARVIVDDKKEITTFDVSLNSPITIDGYSLCINSVLDGNLSLIVAHDTFGRTISFVGYLFMFVAFLMLFFDRQGGFCNILQQLRDGRLPKKKAAAAADGNTSFSRLAEKMLILLLCLLVLWCLFWYSRGVFPATNGAEALMLLAFFVALLAVVLKFKKEFAFLSRVLLVVAGIIAVVAGCSFDWNGEVQPILRTPLLSVHVTTIIIAYALLGCTAINAVVALCGKEEWRGRLALLGHLLLYPATMLLACGIFIGAVWASISWGRYWGWDPKEVWALVTLLVCSLAFHTRSLRFLSSPLAFHIFCIVAFLVMLFTFFGVNYLLGGLHSYA